MRAVFLDYDTVSAGDLDNDALKNALPNMAFYGVTHAHELAGRVADAEILLTNKITVDAALMAMAPDLKLVCLAATGTNGVDLEAAAARGVRVCNIEAYCTSSVVQHVFALTLSLTCRLREHERYLRGDAWRSAPQYRVTEPTIHELAGKTMGIVGLGELGRGVARVAESFGMEVIVLARPGSAPAGDRVPREEFLQRADVVSLHCPLTPGTRGLIGERELKLMKPTALLINTARGALVDERALLAALKNGVIAGAGIDVLSQEPPADGNPLLDVELDNLIVTPHIAWAAREARQRALDEMTANVLSFLKGGTRGVVEAG